MKFNETKDASLEKNISSSLCSFIKGKEEDPVLCDHCLRTASNGIRCMGICVADNDY
tara:strand:+ start:626 stop:796 length:171 start_codon:yes stop_codon:yes gene_type:complete